MSTGPNLDEALERLQANLRTSEMEELSASAFNKATTVRRPMDGRCAPKLGTTSLSAAADLPPKASAVSSSNEVRAILTQASLENSRRLPSRMTWPRQGGPPGNPLIRTAGPVTSRQSLASPVRPVSAGNSAEPEERVDEEQPGLTSSLEEAQLEMPNHLVSELAHFIWSNGSQPARLSVRGANPWEQAKPPGMHRVRSCGSSSSDASIVRPDAPLTSAPKVPTSVSEMYVRSRELPLSARSGRSTHCSGSRGGSNGRTPELEPTVMLGEQRLPAGALHLVQRLAASETVRAGSEPLGAGKAARDAPRAVFGSSSSDASIVRPDEPDLNHASASAVSCPNVPASVLEFSLRTREQPMSLPSGRSSWSRRGWRGHAKEMEPTLMLGEQRLPASRPSSVRATSPVPPPLSLAGAQHSLPIPRCSAFNDDAQEDATDAGPLPALEAGQFRLGEEDPPKVSQARLAAERLQRDHEALLSDIRASAPASSSQGEVQDERSVCADETGPLPAVPFQVQPRSPSVDHAAPPSPAKRFCEETSPTSRSVSDPSHRGELADVVESLKAQFAEERERRSAEVALLTNRVRSLEHRARSQQDAGAGACFATVTARLEAVEARVSSVFARLDSMERSGGLMRGPAFDCDGVSELDQKVEGDEWSRRFLENAGLMKLNPGEGHQSSQVPWSERTRTSEVPSAVLSHLSMRLKSLETKLEVGGDPSQSTAVLESLVVGQHANSEANSALSASLATLDGARKSDNASLFVRIADDEQRRARSNNQLLERVQALESRVQETQRVQQQHQEQQQQQQQQQQTTAFPHQRKLEPINLTTPEDVSVKSPKSRSWDVKGRGDVTPSVSDRCVESSVLTPLKDMLSQLVSSDLANKTEAATNKVKFSGGSAKAPHSDRRSLPVTSPRRKIPGSERGGSLRARMEYPTEPVVMHTPKSVIFKEGETAVQTRAAVAGLLGLSA
eukprot:CAMPEP_0194552252 /NCGR_PEP_ID=MMETSP0253-20130528/96631_1 /TAXON_ID=2966 /ORGANISM="Noctiluca scintillans" /LENGTH=959 /DNA_ID=CAMNT_0039399717 /DNA_START=49 /DNA_END=2929 /DNA_ORIENTATION=-